MTRYMNSVPRQLVRHHVELISKPVIKRLLGNSGDVGLAENVKI
jgi:hypothetical protein